MIPSSPGRKPFLVVTLCSLVLLTVGACRSAGGSPSLSEPTGESLFDFRIDFGMNLHHFLFWTADPHGRTPSEGVPLAWPDDLEPAEQAAVDGAVGYYRETFGGKDLLFTQDLMAIKFALIEHGGSDEFAALELEAEHVRHLEAVAPVYRRHCWDAHRRASEAFRDGLLLRLSRDGQRMRTLMVERFQDPFPATPIRVDLVAEGHWAGAYTTIEPTHAVVVAPRAAHRGFAGVEIVFHETAHGMVGPGRGHSIEALDAALRESGHDHPGDFWHALQFETVGWAARTTAREQGENYVDLAQAKGLWNGRWKPFKPLLDAYWVPYLDGDAGFDEAITNLANALAELDG